MALGQASRGVVPGSLAQMCHNEGPDLAAVILKMSLGAFRTSRSASVGSGSQPR